MNTLIILIFNFNIILNTVNALLSPTFPNNIVCFPERDFCTIEKFIEYTNNQLTLNVYRDTELTGSAIGTVSGADIAFEVNHPGALCWGDGTNLKVTPNIKINDKIEIKHNNLLLAEMLIKNGYIINKNINNNIITINGYLDNNVNLNNIELRIVNPDLKNTIIGRRDVRATYGNIIPVGGGYMSGISVNNNDFIATFEFLDTAVAKIVFNGAFSLSMWDITDNLGNRLGITISEFEEIGGPWSLLCPLYANYISTNLKKVIISDQIIKWDSNIKLLTDSLPITGFDITVMKKINDDVNEINGFRFNKNINKYDFKKFNILLTDIIEVRTVIDNKLSDPLIINLNNLVDQPDIIITPQYDNIIIYTDTVELNSNSGQVIYTLDNTIPNLDNGIIYSEPITIIAETKINAIAYSFNGKTSNVISGLYMPSIKKNNYLPPNNLNIKILSNSFIVNWDNINDPLINLYKLNIYSNNILIKSIETTLNQLSINNLIPETEYYFTISAKYDITWSAESIKTNLYIFPKIVDNIIVTSAKWKSTDFRITGTSSMINSIVTLYYSNLDNTISLITINIRNTNAAITANVINVPDINNNYVFDIRVTKNQVPNNPIKFFIKSSNGAISNLIIL